MIRLLSSFAFILGLLSHVFVVLDRFIAASLGPSSLACASDAPILVSYIVAARTTMIADAWNTSLVRTELLL